MIASLTAEIVRSGIEELEADWWELWRRCPEATVFQSPAWAIPWWQAFHPGELTVLTVRDDGRLIGLGAFYVKDGRRLLPVGISLSDYVDVLLDPAQRATAADALSHLAAQLGCVEWELPELRDGAAGWSLPVPPGYREEVGPASLCPGLTLPHAFPKSMRRKIRMARNRVERRGGMAFVDAPGLLGDILAVHAKRWSERGEPDGLLADRRMAEMLQAAVPQLAKAGLCRLTGLRIGGRLAGGLLTLTHGAEAMAYFVGIDPNFLAESPGTLLIGHAIEQSAEDGQLRFDFLRGDEPYKFDWGCVARLNRRRAFRRD